MRFILEFSSGFHELYFLMFLISLFLNELLMIYVTLWLLITLCNMPKGLVTYTTYTAVVWAINWAMLIYRNPRVPFGISFLVTKGSGISFLESKKQPPEMFCKIRCSEKFQKVGRKTPVLESLFNKITGFQASNFIKKRL